MRTSILASLFVSIFFAASAFGQSTSLITEEIMVRSADPSIEIYVRNKRPAGMTTFRPEQTVL